MRRLALALAPVLLGAAFLGMWEIYVDSGGGVDGLILPAPHQVAIALYDNRGQLWSSLLITAREIVLGALAAGLAALLAAVAMHFSAFARRALYPWLVASQAVPIVVLAPLLVIWLGFGLIPKLIVIVVVSFFSIVVTTLDGLASVDPAMLKLMRTFDASRLRTFRHVELPAALPGLFTGLKLTLVFAVIADVLAEQGAGSGSGLGYVLQISTNQDQTAEAFAATLILSLMTILLFALLTVTERRLLPWAYHPSAAAPR